jgi:serine/threonine protein kinase
MTSFPNMESTNLYSHLPDYIFIDLKPQNVMIMPNSPNPKELNDGNYGRLRIKLTDFGGSLKFAPDENGKQKLSEDDKKYMMSTLFYGAPELNNLSIYQVNS